MTTNSDLVADLKKAVGRAAAERIKSNTIVGLGTGSTTVFAIQHLGERLKSGNLKNIVGIPTSFQSENLARECGIPLTTLNAVDHMDVAIDGADEVDPQKNLIKGGGAAHTQEKLVDSFAEYFIVVVDSSKVVEKLGSSFLLPVEVIPKAMKPVMLHLQKLGGKPEIRNAIKKDGPIITDQGNLVLDVKFDSLDNPEELEKTINNIPGVLNNGLFVGLADLVIVGELKDGQIIVREF